MRTGHAESAREANGAIDLPRACNKPGAFINDDEPAIVIERLFGEILAEPKSGSEKLYAVWMEWTCAGKERSLQALAVMLRNALARPELGSRAHGYATICLTWIMQARLSLAEIEALARAALKLFQVVDEPGGPID